MGKYSNARETAKLYGKRVIAEVSLGSLRAKRVEGRRNGAREGEDF